MPGLGSTRKESLATRPVQTEPGPSPAGAGSRPAPARRVGGRGDAYGLPRNAAWLVAVALFLSISRFHQHVALLAMIRAPMLVSAGATLAALLSMSRWRPGDLSKHWIPIGVAIMAAIAVVGVPFALWPGRAFSFIVDAYSRTLILGLLAWAVARTRAGAEFIAQTIVVSGMAACLLALWRGGFISGGRLSGAYTYDANDLALIANVTIPLTLWWATDRGRRWRQAMWPALLIIFWVVIRSESRGGFLGLAVVAAGLIALAITRAPRRLRRISLATGVLAVLSFPFLPADYRDRVESILSYEEDYNMTSPSGRWNVWKRGIGYALEHPILGVGIDNFSTAEGHISDFAQTRRQGQGWKWSAAHNSFVQVLAELGLIAGAIFAFLIVRTTKELLLWQNRADHRPTRGPPSLLHPMLGLSFAAYAVSGFFLSFAYYDILYILLGLACALMLQGRQPAVNRSHRKHAPVPAGADRNRGPRPHRARR